MIRRAPGLVERALPHSKEAEVAFLGAILLDSVGSTEEMERLDSTDFFLPFHQVIFRALKRLKAEGKPTNDLVVLHDALRETNELEAAGGTYVSTLSDGLPKITNIPYYSEMIKTRAIARRYIRQADANIERLLSANGNLADVLREIDSGLIERGFGQKQSSNLFRTAVDFAKDSQVAEFVVKPYLLAGAVTELVAKIKAGKTTYILAEIVRLALDKGPVVYLTEQPAASFRVALERARLLERENLFILPFNAVVGMDWPAIAKLSLEKCRETSAVLLVVDTLSHFCGLDEDSENDSGTAVTSMKPLQEIASQGIASLTVRHERKSGGEIGDAGRGSSAFGGAADTLLTLRRQQGNGRPTIRKIECISRFDGLPAEALFEYIEGRYQYLGTESEIAEREAEAAILASAPECEEKAKTLDELLEGSEVARTTARRVITKLVECQLKQIGKGKKGNPFRYFLSEKDSGQNAHIDGQKEL
jgi:DnaB-like helicase N terminal domain/AAA domain